LDTKVKCLLLDDELPGLTYLKMLCEQLPDLEVVRAFNNPTVFLQEMPKLDFDLCILDIEMPEMNGLQIANLLKGKPVIFATAYKDFASEAFDLNAVDYIRKPITVERLQQAIRKAKHFLKIEKPQIEKKFIQLNTDKGRTLLFFDQLCYIKTSDVDSRDKIGLLSDGTSLTIKNISYEKLLEKLPRDLFCRINKKEVVAIHSVKVYSYDEITTDIADSNGKMLTLNLSEIYRDEFIRKVNP